MSVTCAPAQPRIRVASGSQMSLSIAPDAAEGLPGVARQDVLGHGSQGLNRVVVGRRGDFLPGLIWSCSSVG
jgi:hypothetical protein